MEPEYTEIVDWFGLGSRDIQAFDKATAQSPESALTITVSMNVSVCSNLDELCELEEEWKDAEHTSGHLNVSASFHWLAHWWRVFGETDSTSMGFSKQLLVLVARKGRAVTAIAPFVLVVRRMGPAKVRYVEFLGQQWGGNLLDLIMPQPSLDDADVLLRWLYAHIRFDILSLAYIPDGSVTMSLPLMNSFLMGGCPAIETHKYQDFADYQKKTYSRNLRQNLRTAANRISNKGYDLKVDFSPFTDDTFRVIKAIAATKVRDGKLDIYADSNVERFARAIGHSLHADVTMLSLDDHKAAFRLNLYFNGGKFCFDAAYDRDFTGLDLGTLSVHESVRDSFSKGVKLHFEGDGLDTYKLKFARDVIPVYRLIRPGNTICGSIMARLARKQALLRETSIAQRLYETGLSDCAGLPAQPKRGLA